MSWIDCGVERYGTWVISRPTGSSCIHRQVLGDAGAGRGVAELAWFSLITGSAPNGLRRYVRIDHQDERRLHVERDRHEVAIGIVGHLFEQREIDRIADEVETSSVWPSGCACATALAASISDAPGDFPRSPVCPGPATAGRRRAAPAVHAAAAASGTMMVTGGWGIGHGPGLLRRAPARGRQHTLRHEASRSSR